MASIWKDIGDRLTQTSQGVAQKMGDAVSITKLNNSIAAEKRKMEGAYRELGQAYFDLHCDEQNGPLASLCASIKDALKKIEGYKDEIGVIRDMTNCPQCGAESPRSSAFCGKCGASLPHKPEPEKAPAADADEAPEESASADADEALEESAPANADEAPEESASADADEALEESAPANADEAPEESASADA